MEFGAPSKTSRPSWIFLDVEEYVPAEIYITSTLNS